LLIIIAIISILFIVLVSKVDFATDKARAVGVQTDFRSYQIAFEMVSKENDGFNTLGWDTGDDNGDRIRNTVDLGDTDEDGVYDFDETWTGQKKYIEFWTGVYTLINPADPTDTSGILELEKAINKHLDPVLRINISPDGTITMANGHQDPWKTEYHGVYLTNACQEAAAIWNTDASMTNSMGDNMDRGAIVMFSNGANKHLGTKVKIESGVVTSTVSLVDANTPDDNVIGKDDFVLNVTYSFANGYGETGVQTSGFVNNQKFLVDKNILSRPVQYIMLSGEHKTISVDDRWFKSNAEYEKFVAVKINGEIVDPENYEVYEGSTVVVLKEEYINTLPLEKYDFEIVSNDGSAYCTMDIREPEIIEPDVDEPSQEQPTIPEPPLEPNEPVNPEPEIPVEPEEPEVEIPDPKPTLNDYSWFTIQTIAKQPFTPQQFADIYNIHLGDQKIDEKTGTIYTLVDFSYNYDNKPEDEDYTYNGFVFMYNSGLGKMAMNTNDTNIGGYGASTLKEYVDGLYDNQDPELQKIIKEVTIRYNDGNKYNVVHETQCKIFIPSLIEMGFYINDWRYLSEGCQFKYFTDWQAISKFQTVEFVGEQIDVWWLRSAACNVTGDNMFQYSLGFINSFCASTKEMNVLTCFVIG
jgi:hypothetical protein